MVDRVVSRKRGSAGGRQEDGRHNRVYLVIGGTHKVKVTRPDEGRELQSSG